MPWLGPVKSLDQLGVTLNREKTRASYIASSPLIQNPAEKGASSFLTIRLNPNYTGRISAIPTWKSVDRFKGQIRACTQGRVALRMGGLIKAINPSPGMGKLLLPSPAQRFAQLDRWIIRRLWLIALGDGGTRAGREYPTKWPPNEFNGPPYSPSYLLFGSRKPIRAAAGRDALANA